MKRVGVSTGAVARGDFRRAWSLLSYRHLPAVEFSALREHELFPLAAWLDQARLPGDTVFSIHAPSHLTERSEAEVVSSLERFAGRGWRIVVHPVVVATPDLWRPLGEALCIENMDMRAHGRTVSELQPLLGNLPQASFCLDLGHARQVDPTLAVARALLAEFGSRLAQVHISEVDASCRHRRLSMASVWAFSALAPRIPDVPVIIESEMAEEELTAEVSRVLEIFELERQSAAV